MRVHFLLTFAFAACCAGVHGAKNASNSVDSLDFITHIRKFLYNKDTKPVYLLSIDRLPYENLEAQQNAAKSTLTGPESYGKANVISPPERHQPNSFEKDTPETSTTRALLNKERLIAKKIKFALYRKSQPFLRYPSNNPPGGIDPFGWSSTIGEQNQESPHYDNHGKANASLADRRRYHNKEQIPQRFTPTESGNDKDKNDKWDPHRRYEHTGQVGSLYSRPHDNQYHDHNNHHHSYKYKSKRRRPPHGIHHGDRYNGYDSLGNHHETGTSSQHSDGQKGSALKDPYTEHKEKPNSHGAHYLASSYYTSHKHRPHNEGYDHEKYDEEEHSDNPGIDGDNLKPNNGEDINPAEHTNSGWNSNGMHDDLQQEDSDRYRLQQYHLVHGDDPEGHGDRNEAGSGMVNTDDPESHTSIASETPGDEIKYDVEGSQENNNQYGAEDDGEEYQSNDHESNTSHENNPDKDVAQPNNSENDETDGLQAHEQQSAHYKPNDITDHQEHQPEVGDAQSSLSSHTNGNHYPEEEETYDPVDEEDDHEDPYDKYPEEDPANSNEYHHSENNHWDPYDNDNDNDDYGPSYSHSDGYYHEENHETAYYNNFQTSKPQQAHKEHSILSTTTQQPNSIENEGILNSSDDREPPASNDDNGNTSLNQQGSNEDNTAPSSQIQNSNNNQGLTETRPPTNSFTPAVTQEPEEIDPDVAPSPQEQGLVSEPAFTQKPLEVVTSRPTSQPPTPQPTYYPAEYYEDELDEEEDLEDYYDDTDTAPSLYDYENSYPSATQDNPSTPSYHEAGYETGYEASSPSTDENPTSPPSYEERRIGKSKRKLRSKLRKRRRRSHAR